MSHVRLCVSVQVSVSHIRLCVSVQVSVSHIRLCVSVQVSVSHIRLCVRYSGISVTYKIVCKVFRYQCHM